MAIINERLATRHWAGADLVGQRITLFGPRNNPKARSIRWWRCATSNENQQGSASTMIEQVVQAWMINNRVNLMLLDNLDKAALGCTLSTRGGRTVGQQLAQVYSVRRRWIEVADKNLVHRLMPAQQRGFLRAHRHS